MDNDLLVNSSTSRALIDFYENRLGKLAQSIRTNNEFMNKLQEISKLNTQISTMEISPDAENDDMLNSQKTRLTRAENDINSLAVKLSEENTSTNNVSYETLVSQWLEQLVLREKTTAQIEARDVMREKLDQDFLYFSPIGATINRKERNIGFVEGNYMSIMGALNQAILRQKNLEMTAATLKVMNPPLFPLNSSATNRRMIVLVTMLGVWVFVIGYFFLVELLDRTLRDKGRAQRITQQDVLGIYPKDSLRYRRYNRAIDEMAIKQISTSILPYLTDKKQRVVNLLSTEPRDGKSHIAKSLEAYWTTMGLKVRRCTYDEDFQSETEEYVQALGVESICPDLQPDEIALIEYPVLKRNPLQESLLNAGSINLLVTRANRTWKDTDTLILRRLLDLKSDDVPLKLLLTQGERDAVEEFTGQLPPYTSFKNFEYRLFQFGLTATEYHK
jgi:hypothetical protein